jgi:hypothetical protein
MTLACDCGQAFVAPEDRQKCRACVAEADLDRAYQQRDAAQSALSIRYAMRREIEGKLGMVSGEANDESLRRGLEAIQALENEREEQRLRADSLDAACRSLHDRLTAAELLAIARADEVSDAWTAFAELQLVARAALKGGTREMANLGAALAVTPEDLTARHDVRVRVVALREGAAKGKRAFNVTPVRQEIWDWLLAMADELEEAK